jgi:hypothetical protein
MGVGVVLGLAVAVADTVFGAREIDYVLVVPEPIVEHHEWTALLFISLSKQSPL